MSKLKKIIIITVILIIIGIGTIVFKGVKSFSIISTGDSLLSLKEDERWDILILGNRGDRAVSGGILTDSIMVLSYEVESGEAALFSIPRDLWVDIPNYGQQRINFAYAAGQATNPPDGGLFLAKEVIGEVIGLDLDFVIVVDVDALRETVDTLGGIEVYEEKYFSSKFYNYYVTISPGVNYLSGSETLAYVGSRDTGSDFGRMDRQQKAILAIRDKVFSLGLLTRPDKVWSMLSTVENHIKTDIPLSQIKDFTTLLSNLEFNDTQQVVFNTSNYLYSTHTTAGAYILLPKNGDFLEIHEVAANIFEKETEEVLENEQSEDGNQNDTEPQL